MATSAFAIPTLQQLAKSQHRLVAVYSKQPQIAGRGKKLTLSPVHEVAKQHNFTIFTPYSLQDEQSYNDFVNLQADVAIVVSYGLILPKKILQATKYGCFNLHPSSLPKFRGAAPIQRTIMAQQNDIDICIIKMDEGLDSGDVVYRQNIDITKQTFTQVADNCANIGAKMILELLENLSQIKPIAQNHQLATYANKINKNECLLDFSTNGRQILATILALSGNLGAYFVHNGESIKILDADFVACNHNQQIGEVAKNFAIYCQDGYILPKIVQKPGKKATNLKDFLLGHRVFARY
jgi:methionyl-tRNA formyltransferase